MNIDKEKDGKPKGFPSFFVLYFISFTDTEKRLVLRFLSLFEACAAVYGSVVGGLEGDLCLSTAFCAYSSEILARSSAGILLCIAARFACLGLVQKALLSIELLLAGGEYELVAAIFAN